MTVSATYSPGTGSCPSKSSSWTTTLFAFSVSSSSFPPRARREAIISPSSGISVVSCASACHSSGGRSTRMKPWERSRASRRKSAVEGGVRRGRGEQQQQHQQRHRGREVGEEGERYQQER